jgi:hypothetical protein
MKRKTMLTKQEWDQAITAIQQMSPVELKKMHIQQAKAALRGMPELADQIEPILDKLRNELLTLKLEAVE